MYLIEIKIKENKIDGIESNKLLEQHKKWFTKNAEKGKFLLVGPFKNSRMSGMIIAKTESRKELDLLLSEDAYYPNLADYSIREFTANIISDNISNYKGE